jgi:PAS domain S-box-containing protein
LGIGFVLGIATLLSVAFAISRSANEFVRTANEVTRINRVLSLLQEVELSITRAESEERGYLVTEDPLYLSSFAGVGEEVERQFSLLRSLEAGNPTHAAIVDQAKRVVDLKLEDMNRILVVRTYLGNEAAQELVSKKRGLVLMEDLRRTFGELENSERNALRQADRTNRLNRDEARLYLFVGLGFAVLVVTISMGIVLRDALRRMRAESRLQDILGLQNAIFDSVGAAIFAFDPDGKITSFNRMAEQLLGYQMDQVLYRLAPTLFHERSELEAIAKEHHISGDALAALTMGARKQERDERRWTLVRRDRRRLPARVTYSVLRGAGGRAAGFVGVATDLTESEARRKELDAYVEQLEATRSTLAAQNEALARATEELKESRDVALAATRLKSEFLANMSHEIRTPMNGVLGMAHLLLQSNLSDRQRSFVLTMQQSAESLLTILNDILDLSKMEAGKMTLEHFPFDLRTTMEELTESLALAAHGKGLELSLDIPPHLPVALMGDAVRLRQIITNLLSNAVKFTESGEVAVSVRGVRETADHTVFRFSVRDTGIGIPQDRLPHIFESFAQADGSTTRRFGGTGLGLAITRQLCHLMGGELGVESSEGQGSEFWVEIPFAVRATESQSSATNLEGCRALVVDDHATNRLIVRELLEAWGAGVIEAESGESSLRILTSSEKDRFDVVIMDMNMPGMDGVSTARQIRSRYPQLPIILLSSLGFFPEQSDAVDLFRAILSKPVRSGQLFETMHVLMAGEDRVDPVQELRPPPRLPGVKVLVVEDNPVNQLVAVEMLHALRCDVEVADDGLAAVARIESGARYDLIFMDVQMPRMDGFEATDRIRKIESVLGHRTPIVAMTANAMSGDRERCLEAGMDDYMAKPLQARELLDRILAHVRVEIQNPEMTTKSLLDREALDRAVSGKVALKRKVLGKYLDASRLQLSRIRDAAASGDYEGLSAAAHNLKGSSLTIGSPTVAEWCARIERTAREGSTDSEAIVGLEDDLLRLNDEIAAVLDTLESTP